MVPPNLVRSEYVMYRIKTRPWPEIVEFYRDLVGKHQHESFRSMIDLVEKIAAADFAKNLYPATSHAQLKISYYPDFHPDGEFLNVDLEGETGQIKFEYQETPSPLYKRWKRVCQPSEAFEVFQRFLQLKKWFPLTPSLYSSSPRARRR